MFRYVGLNVQSAIQTPSALLKTSRNMRILNMEITSAAVNTGHRFTYEGVILHELKSKQFDYYYHVFILLCITWINNLKKNVLLSLLCIVFLIFILPLGMWHDKIDLL